MTICYFGIYDPGYSRNRVLIEGFKQNGIKVLECRSEKKGIHKYIDLFKKHNQLRNKYDVMFVAFPGQQAMILARILTRKKIIFDAFTSLYDSLILDRKNVRIFNPLSLYYWALDFLACRFANKIICDTGANINFFSTKFRIDKKKFIRVFVGSDNRVIYPKENKSKMQQFIIHFHGSYIPLQGVDIIMEAVKILKNNNIIFNVIGSKIKRKYENHAPENINFFENIPYNELADKMSEADICLGIFGNTDKANRVIPNKIYEAMAVKKAIITMETDAIKELLENKKNVLFTNANDSEDLANKILELKNNALLREEIAKNGYELFMTITPKILVNNLLLELK